MALLYVITLIVLVVTTPGGVVVNVSAGALVFLTLLYGVYWWRLPKLGTLQLPLLSAAACTNLALGLLVTLHPMLRHGHLSSIIVGLLGIGASLGLLGILRRYRKT